MPLRRAGRAAIAEAGMDLHPASLVNAEGDTSARRFAGVIAHPIDQINARRFLIACYIRGSVAKRPV